MEWLHPSIPPFSKCMHTQHMYTLSLNYAGLVTWRFSFNHSITCDGKNYHQTSTYYCKSRLVNQSKSTYTYISLWSWRASSPRDLLAKQICRPDSPSVGQNIIEVLPLPAVRALYRHVYPTDKRCVYICIYNSEVLEFNSLSSVAHKYMYRLFDSIHPNIIAAVCCVTAIEGLSHNSHSHEVAFLH